MSDVETDRERVMADERSSVRELAERSGSPSTDGPKRAAAPPGWWLAADGKWYPPVSTVETVTQTDKNRARPLADPPSPGWWLASDDKWYAPDLLEVAAPLPATLRPSVTPAPATLRPSVTPTTESGGSGSAGPRTDRPSVTPGAGSARGSGSWFDAMDWVRGSKSAKGPSPADLPSPQAEPQPSQPLPPLPPPQRGPTAPVAEGDGGTGGGEATSQPIESSSRSGRLVEDLAPPDPAGRPGSKGRRRGAAEWDFIPSADLVEQSRSGRKSKLSGRLRRPPKAAPEAPADEDGESLPDE